MWVCTANIMNNSGGICRAWNTIPCSSPPGETFELCSALSCHLVPSCPLPSLERAHCLVLEDVCANVWQPCSYIFKVIVIMPSPWIWKGVSAVWYTLMTSLIQQVLSAHSSWCLKMFFCRCLSTLILSSKLLHACTNLAHVLVYCSFTFFNSLKGPLREVDTTFMASS